MASAEQSVREFKNEVRQVKLSDIRFNEAVYPRKNGHNPAIVQRYAGEIEQIEAAGAYITIAEDMDILDGRHRWLGYRAHSPTNAVARTGATVHGPCVRRGSRREAANLHAGAVSLRVAAMQRSDD